MGQYYGKREAFINIWAESGMNSKTTIVKQLVSREMLVLVRVLLGYKNYDNRLRVWEKVDWIVSLFLSLASSSGTIFFL